MDVQEDNTQSKAKNVKVVIMGESSVGKTCIVSVINTGKCLVNSSSTVGAGFIVKKFDFDGKQIKLSIWDTAGQEKYRSLVPMYFRDMRICILVYAINSLLSFERLNDWVREIRAEFDELPSIYVLGNKADMESERAVSWEKGSEFAKKIGATFMEVSALTQPLEIHQFIRNVAAGMVHEEAPVTKTNSGELQLQEKKDSCC